MSKILRGGGDFVHVYKNEQGGFCPGGLCPYPVKTSLTINDALSTIDTLHLIPLSVCLTIN